jgi:hypothetical protein
LKNGKPGWKLFWREPHHRGKAPPTWFASTRAAAGGTLFLPGIGFSLEDKVAHCTGAARFFSCIRPVAECMAARLAVERRRGSATGNIVMEVSLPRRSMKEGV